MLFVPAIDLVQLWRDKGSVSRWKFSTIIFATARFSHRHYAKSAFVTKGSGFSPAECAAIKFCVLYIGKVFYGFCAIYRPSVGGLFVGHDALKIKENS